MPELEAEVFVEGLVVLAEGDDVVALGEMDIEVPHENLVVLHDIDLILLLTGHLDVDDGSDELLRFLVSDEHLLEVDHLLRLQLPPLRFLLAVELFNQEEVLLFPSRAAVGLEGPAHHCVLGGVVEGDGSAAVDVLIEEVVEVVGAVVVVDLLPDAGPLCRALEEELLAVGVAVEREGVDDCDLLLGQGLDGVVAHAIVEAVDLSQLDLPDRVVDQRLDGGGEVGVDKHVLVVRVLLVPDDRVYLEAVDVHRHDVGAQQVHVLALQVHELHVGLIGQLQLYAVDDGVVLLERSHRVLADDCDLIVHFLEAAAVPDDHLGRHVGVVLADDDGVVELVLPRVCHRPQLDLLLVAELLLLSRVPVAEPAVHEAVRWQRHPLCVDSPVLGAVHRWELHGRAGLYCLLEVDRHYVVQPHPLYFLQLSSPLEDHLVRHVADHRVRPHEPLANSAQKTHPPLLQVLVLVELEDLVLHPGAYEVLREASDAVGKTGVVGVVGLVIEVEGFGHVFDDKRLAEFEESDINLEVKVVFSVVVEASEDVDVVGVWHLEASAATPRDYALVGLVGRQELYGLAGLGLRGQEDEVGDPGGVGGVRELAHQRFCLIVEHGPEEQHVLAVLEVVEPREVLVGLQLERLPTVVEEVELLQLDLGLVHLLNPLVHHSVVVAQDRLAVMHQMIEQVHNCVLAFLLGLDAHLGVFAEVDQVRHPALLNLELQGDELVRGLALLDLRLFELSDVLVILVLALPLDGELVAQHEVLPLSLEVLPRDVLHEGVLIELLLADYLQ